MKRPVGSLIPDSPRWSRWFWPVLALGLLLVHGLTFRFVIDDAFISFRFAQNLLDGHGLVFNPGDRVEGYSNLLWVLLNAVGMKLGVPSLLWARILGTLSMAGLLLLLPRVMRYLVPDHVSDSPWPGRLAQLLLAASGSIACWMLAGLETPLFALLTVAAWCAALRRAPLQAGIFGLLLVLTRPEGPSLALIFSVWSLLPDRKARQNSPSIRGIRWLGPLLLVVGTGLFFLWRHSYYGWWFPNTYYAKTGDLAGQLRTGLPYGKSFLLAYVLPLAVAGGAAIVRNGPAILRSREMIFSLGVMLFWSGYVVIVGGDTLGMYRFFVPILPLLTTWTAALLAAAGWLSKPRRALLISLVLAVALLPASRWGREPRLTKAHMREANLAGWILAGDAMARQLPAGSTIALGPAGYIPWRTGFRTWDFYGIIDSHIAHTKTDFSAGIAGHEKHDGAYIVSRKPDYLLIGNVDITDRPRPGLIPPMEVEKDIVLNKDFQRSYEKITLRLANGKFLNLFARIDRRR